MSFSRAFQWYHSHLDPIWPDGTFKRTYIQYLYMLLVENRFFLSSSLPLSRGPPLGCRAEIRTRACLTASRRATICATPHPNFAPRRTLFAPRRTLFVPRRTLFAPRRTLICATPHPSLRHAAPFLRHAAPCLRHAAPCLRHAAPYLRHAAP